MYLTIAILGALFFLGLFSQFGSRLPARHAMLWWAVCFLILGTALWPGFTQYVAGLLGVTLASNLLFAGLFLLLIFLLVEQSVELTRHQRLLREVATKEAARSYMESAPHEWGSLPGPRVMVVLPTFNEASSIPILSSQLCALAKRLSFAMDFCFVDDGSSDDTPNVLATDALGHFASHPTNMGVAGALLTGIKIAELRKADLLIQCDADGQHPVAWIERMIETAKASGADLLIGSRFASGQDSDTKLSTTRWRRMGGWLIALALKGFRLPARITDPTSGFRVYSPKAFRFLSRYMPDEYPEPESIALLAWANMKIVEMPVPMQSRKEGVSTIRGLKTLRYITKVFGALMGLRLRMLFSSQR